MITLNKLNRFFTNLILMVLAWLMLTSSAFAYVKVTNQDWSKIETWRQWNPNESNHYKIIPFSGAKVDSAACSWFSVTYALRKNGIVNDMFTPLSSMDKVKMPEDIFIW